MLSPRINKRYEAVHQPKVVFGSSKKQRITSFQEQENSAMKNNKPNEDVCEKYQNAMKRPHTASNYSMTFSPRANQHKTFKSGRFYAGGPARVGGTQNHTITNAQPDSGLKITSLSTRKNSRSKSLQR